MENKLPANQSPQADLPQKFQRSIAEMGKGDKLGYLAVISDLMPKGQPNYLEVVKYPKVEDLITSHGKPEVMLLISIIVRDFCASMNVVRNMNEDQILEAACMLMDECDNFRLEDYAMMFAMAKRGGLIKIRDRIDLEVISEIWDAYWIKRHQVAIQQEEAEIQKQEGQIYMERTGNWQPVHYYLGKESQKIVTDELNHSKR